MKECPIIFSGPMVRAILNGRKTQTRRLMSPGNSTVDGRRPNRDLWAVLDFSRAVVTKNANPTLSVPRLDDDDRCHRVRPVIEPGDRLWVREAWRTGSQLDKLSALEIQAKCEDVGYRTTAAATCCPIWYEVDGKHRVWTDSAKDDVRDFGQKGRYRWARFMPRWASRITLEVTDVRAQRLQDISEEDAKAEGVDAFYITDGLSSRRAFRELWGRIHGHESWTDNPLVWAYTFRVTA